MRILKSQRDPDLPYATERITSWSLYNGHGRLYIVGMGERAWFPVTGFNSSKTSHGTADERDVARNAIGILSKRFRERYDATPKDIMDALLECGWEPDEFTRYCHELKE